MKLIAGNSNLPLARAIADYLELPLTDASVRRFADEEVFVEIHENVRGEDVFVLQSTSFPANDNLMELLICIDALRRASAKRITAVIPYFGYARQDRKPGPRTPISAKLVANLITEAGADRVLSVDLHAGQIQGFFDIPTDNLYAAPVMAADIQARFGEHELMVVSPDVGGVVRARALAKRLDNAPLAIVDKRRERAGESEVMNIIGDVEGPHLHPDRRHRRFGRHAVQRRRGADGRRRRERRRLFHPRRAVGRRGGAGRQSALTELVITDSIAADDAAEASGKIRLLTIAPLLGEAIRRIADESSVSSSVRLSLSARRMPTVRASPAQTAASGSSSHANMPAMVVRGRRPRGSRARARGARAAGRKRSICATSPAVRWLRPARPRRSTC